MTTNTAGRWHPTNHELRDQIEQAVASQGIDPARWHEVSKQSWQGITDKAVAAFTIWHGNDLHWCWQRLREPAYLVGPANRREEYGPGLMARIIPDTKVYVFVEDTFDKLWVYEADPVLLATVLGETCHDEYLVVSKKFDWLLGENHHEVLFACGDLAVTWLRAATSEK